MDIKLSAIFVLKIRNKPKVTSKREFITFLTISIFFLNIIINSAITAFINNINPKSEIITVGIVAPFIKLIIPNMTYEKPKNRK